MGDDVVPVPEGERRDLQRTAQETGERLGRQDAEIAAHSAHFVTLNGNLKEQADATNKMATEMALQSKSIKNIEEALALDAKGIIRKRELSWQMKVSLACVALAFCGALFLNLLGIAVTIVLFLL